MRVELRLDGDALEEIVGTECYDEALRYVRDGAVVQSVWVAEQNALCGIVRGRHGVFYTPSVYFAAGRAAGGDGPAGLEVHSAQCSCSARYGCEHAAALLLAAAANGHDGAIATTGFGASDGADAGAGTGTGAYPERAASWARSLDTLLTPAGEEADGGPEVTLAVELSLAPGNGGTRLMARLVQPGKSGAWVSGSLSWAKLDTYHYYGGYRTAHVRLLRELYALHRARVNESYYYYSRTDERSIDLSAFESARLWPLLDEAEEAGLRLVHTRKPGGLIRRHAGAELTLDITDDSQVIRVTPALKVAGEAAKLITFIGPDAHGVVCEDARAFSLAPLTRPVPPQLQDLAMTGTAVEIPVGERERFMRAYYPRLRKSATLTCSDGTFGLPDIAPPVLTVEARYGQDHELEIGWGWDGERDAAAERALLDRLPALLPPGTRLTGLDTMRFSTEVLPLLRGHDQVKVEISGEQPEYREAGDALRIEVGTTQRDGDTDWFDLGITVAVEGKQVPFTSLFVALSRGESHLLLPDGAYFSLDKPELRALGQLIEEARALQDQDQDGLKISRFQAGLWEELAALGITGRQADSWRDQVGALLTASTDESISPPTTVRADLRPYQLDGFRWLAFLHKHRLGGILADDMGLGKTLQTLALISHAREQGNDKPFLIVAPTSVVANWAAEAQRFTPDLTIQTVTRRGMRPARADAVVTSYTLLRLDFEDYAEQAWEGLILDEAQFTKNHQSQIYQCARKLPAEVKIAITGTPMENNLMELWSLLSITAPGLFPRPDRFKEYYATPIEKKGDAELLAQLKRRIRPLMKRRTKEQVASDLPAKQEQVLEVELHPRHRKLYQTHLQRERQKVLGLIGDLNANRFTILRSLTLLRQLSLHPALVDTVHGDIPCAKIDTLIEQVRDVAGAGHRALVFSQFTSFLSHVRIRLAAAGIEASYLDGSTRDRPGVLRDFKNGENPVFLISLKAGGFGLNLTEADYCFLLDPWWNPATEAQAVDRTHRIGQTRNVMVYRLISKDTIEEKVLALQQRKAALFTDVMDDGNAFGGALTVADIQALFD